VVSQLPGFFVASTIRLSKDVSTGCVLIGAAFLQPASAISGAAINNAVLIPIDPLTAPLFRKLSFLLDLRAYQQAGQSPRRRGSTSFFNMLQLFTA
jgi:hypothetical protein